MCLVIIRLLIRISTHTSLAGRDNHTASRNLRFCQISTHTSLAGRDDPGGSHSYGDGQFLLTRPSRDVTNVYVTSVFIHCIISTHTSLAGRDKYFRCCLSLSVQFLLTRPSRDVTFLRSLIVTISIFLLTRPSRDVTFAEVEPDDYTANFYSHVPRGT